VATLKRFAPGLATLADYRREWLAGDVAAGSAIAAVSLPMALAYAAMVGVPSMAGLQSAILPLAVYALCGPSRRLVVGPDTAMCAVMAGVLVAMDLPEGAARLPAASALALVVGVACLAGAALGAGRAAGLLAKPVLVGFLTGVAATLLGGQIARVTGVPLEARGLFRPLIELSGRLSEVHAATLILALVLFAAIRAGQRLWPGVPAVPIVLVAAIAVSAIFDLGSAGVALVGDVPGGWPQPALPLPDVPLDLLLEGGGAVAIIGFASGIVPARAFGAREGLRTDPNRELTGFGLANLAAGLVQGFGVTGTSSRTAVAYSAGARSPLAALIAAALLALVSAFLTGPLALLPQAALGAILVSTAIDMVDASTFRRLWQIDRVEFVIAVLTTAGVVGFGVLPAVAVAVVLTLLNFLRMASWPRDARLGRIPGRAGLWKLHLYPEAEPIPGILVYQFQGSPVFVTADRLGERLPHVIRRARAGTTHLVLDCSAMTSLDSTGVEILEHAVSDAARRGMTTLIGGGHARFRKRLTRSPLLAGLQRFETAELAVAAIEAGMA
jgi:high affinity sulfate transporter 1